MISSPLISGLVQYILKLPWLYVVVGAFGTEGVWADLMLISDENSL
jgi:hypothetical protein